MRKEETERLKVNVDVKPVGSIQNPPPFLGLPHIYNQTLNVLFCEGIASKFT